MELYCFTAFVKKRQPGRADDIVCPRPGYRPSNATLSCADTWRLSKVAVFSPPTFSCVSTAGVLALALRHNDNVIIIRS